MVMREDERGGGEREELERECESEKESWQIFLNQRVTYPPST